MSPPRRQSVHAALANVHECVVSPSLLSLSSVEQVARRFSIPGVRRRIEVRLRASSLLNLNIIVHVQGKFADLKFTVFAR